MEETLFDKMLGKRRFILLTVVIISVIYLVFSYGFLSISVSGASSGNDIIVTYMDQKSGKSKSKTISGNSSVNIFVRRGSYQVSVTQGNGSGLSVTKSNGFLTKAYANINLKQKLGVQFIGDNPGACVNYEKSILYSYDCSGSAVDIHVAATSTQPTYNKKIDLGVGNIEGIVNTQGGLVVVAQPSGEDGASETTHYAYLLNNSLVAISKKTLSSLDSNTEYAAIAYKSGFLVYSDDFSDIQYFESIQASPNKINLEKPSDSGQKPYKLATSGDNLVVEYSSKAGQQEESTGNDIGGAKVTVVFYSNGQSKKFDLDRQYDEVGVCATTKICLLDSYSHNLSVYDVTDKAKFEYLYSDVDNFATDGKQTVLLSSNKLVGVDVNSKSGYNIFSSDNYRLCGVKIISDGYLLCGGGKKTYELYISNKFTYDGIEEKFAKIQEFPEIKLASIYKNQIFITPNLGDLVYIQSLNEFGYDPAIKASTRASLTSKIKGLNLGSGYSVTLNGLN